MYVRSEMDVCQGRFRYLVENMVKCDGCGYTVGVVGDLVGMEGKPCPRCVVQMTSIREVAVFDEADVVAAFEAGLRVGRGE